MHSGYTYARSFSTTSHVGTYLAIPKIPLSRTVLFLSKTMEELRNSVIGVVVCLLSGQSEIELKELRL